MPTFSLPLPDEAATERLGATLAARLRPRDVVALVGGLGAGKTTLARAVLRAASGQPAMVVPSPTFTLVEVYDTPRGVFWHFDLYRLGSLLPKERLMVTLSIDGEGRRATLEGEARFGEI